MRNLFAAITVMLAIGCIVAGCSKSPEPRATAVDDDLAKPAATEVNAATDAAAVEGSATKMEGSETKAETEVDAAVDAAQGSASKMEADVKAEGSAVKTEAEGSAPKTEGSEVK
jgi:hypothetical protein